MMTFGFNLKPGRKFMCDVGILTFHCADNFGAMLQAYGLKEYLRKGDADVEIVRYEPPFMAGRHWWIPYVPRNGFQGVLYSVWHGGIRNLKMGRKFFERKKHMNEFRKKYLIRKGQKKILFAKQFENLPYQYYIVGSDQIWNPSITLGLKEVYFGVFENRNKKKVLSYAASLGSVALPSEYDQEFSRLINCLDAVSVREGASIPYIRQFYKKNICAVPDPVFLLSREEWIKLEKQPDKTGYIFVYMTEKNEALINYVENLSKEKELLVVKIESEAKISGENVLIDYVSGPSEFLGYIHKAEYVVTNSFHGIAFSIIYQKKFAAFQHSSVGERIRSILSLHGLEDRIYQKEENIDIDCKIAWDMVRRRTEENVKLAENYLWKNIK